MSALVKSSFPVICPNYVGSEIENRSESFILKGEDVPLRKGQPQFGKIFLDILDKYHDLSAMIDADTEKELTYGELKEKSIRLALWLRKHYIGKGDVISLFTGIRIDAPIFFLAALYEGITFSPWLPAFNLETARHKLKITHPKVIFSTLAGLDILQEACKLENQNPIIITLENHKENVSLEKILDSVSRSEIDTYEPVIIDNLEKDVSMIFFTSGSTGFPKGAAHSYLSIINNFIREYPLTYPNQKGRPTLLSYFPPTFTVWYRTFITGMFEGGVYIVHDKFDPVQTTKVIKKFQVNFFFILPYEIAQYVHTGVVDSMANDLTSIEEFYTASSTISPAVYDTFKRKVGAHAVLRNCYGLTETSYGLLTLMDGKSRANTTADPIGFVDPNVRMKIVDLETGNPLGPNKNGEICIKLPHMFLGYYNAPEETKKSLDSEGWFHSGDFGYYDEKGELFYVERLKDMIKYNGTYVMGSRIEQELLKHPDVLGVCVVPVPDIYDGELPLAFVVKRMESKVTEKELIKLSSTLGDDNTLRSGVVFLEALPRLPNGKVAKVQLKQMAKAYERKYD